MPIDPLSIGLTAGSTLLSLFGSQSDPERFYDSNLAALTSAIEGQYALDERRLKRRANRDTAVSDQMASREAASLGYTGSVGAFAAPGQVRIAERLNDALLALQEQKQASMLQLRRDAITNRPYVKKPNFFDYAGAVVGAGGKIYTQQRQADLALADQRKQGDSLLKTLADSTLSKNGQTEQDGTINRYMNMSIGAPAENTTLGSDAPGPLSGLSTERPLYGGGLGLSSKFY